jgi:transcription termination/antitermination protein NusG
MDEHEIEEHSDEEPQEPMIESTEAPQIARDDSARDVDSASEAETEGQDASEAVEESSPVAPEAQAAPAPEMQQEPVVQTETEDSPRSSGSRPGSQSYSGSRGAQFAQGDIPPEASTEPAWYVIHCYSGYENKVRHNLEQRIETMGMKDRIFDVVIPTQEEIEVREGKRRTVERHIFPGYVLVNMSLSEESWYVVRNTPGVTGFVGMGNLPTALRPEEVSQIIKRMEAEAPTVKVTFKVGERVRIIDGPFNDFRGTVAEIDMERTKVRVMVSFFGRETPVELDFLQVEKA